jgi:hypothetical protein
MARYLDVCHFGPASMLEWSMLHPELQQLTMEAIRRAPRHLDFSLLCGWRGKVAQERAFSEGNSQKHWPDSEHNAMDDGHPCSNAVDIRPASPFVGKDWEDKIRFGRIVGFIECVAADLAIPIRCGLDWNSDGRSIDERFPDLGHIERRKKQ